MKYIIDGNNIVRNQQHTITLKWLLAICLVIKERNDTFFCYFDANINHVIREHCNDSKQELEILERLLEINTRFFRVPSQTIADDYILDDADREGAYIISNDTYKQYLNKFKWLERDSKPRRLYPIAIVPKGNIHSLTVPMLNIHQEISGTIVDYYNGLHKYIGGEEYRTLLTNPVLYSKERGQNKPSAKQINSASFSDRVFTIAKEKITGNGEIMVTAKDLQSYATIIGLQPSKTDTQYQWDCKIAKLKGSFVEIKATVVDIVSDRLIVSDTVNKELEIFFTPSLLPQLRSISKHTQVCIYCQITDVRYSNISKMSLKLTAVSITEMQVLKINSNPQKKYYPFAGFTVMIVVVLTLLFALGGWCLLFFLGWIAEMAVAMFFTRPNYSQQWGLLGLYVGATIGFLCGLVTVVQEKISEYKSK